MADVLLNGRRPLEWELPVIERDRDLEQLAGLLAEYPRPAEPGGRPVTDLFLELS